MDKNCDVCSVSTLLQVKIFCFVAELAWLSNFDTTWDVLPFSSSK